MSKEIIFPWRIINLASAIAMKLPQNEPNHNIKFSAHQHVRIFHSFWSLFATFPWEFEQNISVKVDSPEQRS